MPKGYKSIHEPPASRVSIEIDVDTVITEYDGKPTKKYDVIDGKQVEVGVLTFGDIVIMLVNNKELEGLDIKQKLSRYNLCMRIAQGGIQKFSPEDLVIIRDIVGKNGTPLVVGKVFALTEDSSSEL